MVLLLRGAKAGVLPAVAAEPGSGSDPVLTRASLEGRLVELTAGTRQQLQQLQERLDRVEEGIQGVQAVLQGAPFPDLRGHPAQGAVAFLRERGIISGYPDGRFHPEAPVSRGALAVMLARAQRLPLDPAEGRFRDLASTHWAAGAVAACRKAGWLQGYPDGCFRPDRGVTRAEVAAVLIKAFPVKGGAAVSFRDLDGHWAADAILGLAEAGILKGFPDGSFRPNQVMGRGEVAVALARCLQR